MLTICIGRPGTGKTHWLVSQNPTVMVDGTNKSHRLVLATIADALSISYSSRSTIDDLINLITSTSATTIGIDNIDRLSLKANYSVLRLAQHHTVFATATDRKRIRHILERHTARIVSPPPCDIRKMLAERYPELPATVCASIAATAPNPAAAVAAAEAILSGQPEPTPTATNLTPLLALFAMAFIYVLRWHHHEPLAYVLLTVLAILARRLSWRK